MFFEAFVVPHTFIAAFASALQGTSTVFLMGAAGFWMVYRNWIKPQGLVPLGRLVAILTLPCQIFSQFAQRFDPQAFEGWWKVALIGLGVTMIGLLMGWSLSKRHAMPEAALLVGYQNSGYFVLPMLAALLPPDQYVRASVYLFVFVIPFNATLWPMASWLLLGQKRLDLKAILSPVTLSIIAALVLFGFFHDLFLSTHGSMVYQMLIGGKSPGAVTMIGDLTVPLATLVLGGSIAATFVTARETRTRVGYRRAAVEVCIAKLILYPLLGLLFLRAFPGAMWTHDHALWLLLMLEFAAPPSVNLSVFCQQHNYAMRLIPAACLVTYVVCLITVPFWVAFVPG